MFRECLAGPSDSYFPREYALAIKQAILPGVDFGFATAFNRQRLTAQRRLLLLDDAVDVRVSPLLFREPAWEWDIELLLGRSVSLVGLAGDWLVGFGLFLLRRVGIRHVFIAVHQPG